MALRNGKALVPYYRLVIGGEEVNEYYKQFITQIEFEDSDVEAGLVRIDINDLDFKFSKRFNYYKGVKVQLTLGFENYRRIVMDKGEVTHFEASFNDDGVQNLTIGVIDTSSSMNYTKKNRSWKKVKASDVATLIAREYGYKSEIQDSKEVRDQLSQENETDAQFLKKIASDEGFEFYVFPDKKAMYFGEKFNNLSIKDVLYYKEGDYTIVSFSPSLVEKNKKQEVESDGNSSRDKSLKSGKNVGSKHSMGKGNGRSHEGGSNKNNSNYRNGTMSATVNVTVEDQDEGVDVVGLTGAERG